MCTRGAEGVAAAASSSKRALELERVTVGEAARLPLLSVLESPDMVRGCVAGRRETPARRLADDLNAFQPSILPFPSPSPTSSLLYIVSYSIHYSTWTLAPYTTPASLPPRFFASESILFVSLKLVSPFSRVTFAAPGSARVPSGCIECKRVDC